MKNYKRKDIDKILNFDKKEFNEWYRNQMWVAMSLEDFYRYSEARDLETEVLEILILWNKKHKS